MKVGYNVSYTKDLLFIFNDTQNYKVAIAKRANYRRGMKGIYYGEKANVLDAIETSTLPVKCIRIAKYSNFNNFIVFLILLYTSFIPFIIFSVVLFQL